MVYSLNIVLFNIPLLVSYIYFYNQCVINNIFLLCMRICAVYVLFLWIWHRNRFAFCSGATSGLFLFMYLCCWIKLENNIYMRKQFHFFQYVWFVSERQNNRKKKLVDKLTASETVFSKTAGWSDPTAVGRLWPEAIFPAERAAKLTPMNDFTWTCLFFSSFLFFQTDMSLAASGISEPLYFLAVYTILTRTNAAVLYL